MWRRVSVWEVCEWKMVMCGINGKEMIGTAFFGKLAVSVGLFINIFIVLSFQQLISMSFCPVKW